MDEPRNYLVRKASQAPRLAAADPTWSAAETLSIDVFPWHEAGAQQGTRVGLLYDETSLYVLFICEDAHIYSVETRPNGPVCNDSCVELFAQPNPDEDDGYFNFEANCCGTMHLGFGGAREARRLAEPAVFNQLCVTTSIPTPTRAESPSDDGWWLAAAIPFASIGEFAGKQVRPAGGTLWRANFYRCGGQTDGQYACWNPIDWAKPDYHRPEFFGTLTFE